MKERERLEDFRGGHVACRGCRKLLYFDPNSLPGEARVCCGFAYVMEQPRIDCVIYQGVGANEFAGVKREVPEPQVVIDEGEHQDMPEEPYEETEEDQEFLAGMAVTKETAKEREADRTLGLKKRGER